MLKMNNSFFKYTILSGILFFFFSSCCATGRAKKRFKLPAALREVSGLYIQNDSSFWWLNDGGNPAILYQTNPCGKETKRIAFEDLHNKDWEDLSQDEQGNIYIGDFGNNANTRKDLRIYIFNPKEESLDSILFHYPDQKHFPPRPKFRNFDMEAFFWHQGKLHLFSKNKLGHGNYYCKHYTLEARAGTQTAQLLDSIYLPKRVVTAAAISPDGKTVALLAYHFKMRFGFLPNSAATVFYFSDFQGDLFFNGKMHKRRIPPYVIATQFESLDFFDNRYIYVASEQTLFIKAKAKRLRLRF